MAYTITCNCICCYYGLNVRMAFHGKFVSVDYQKKSSPFGKIFIRSSSGSSRKISCLLTKGCLASMLRGEVLARQERMTEATFLPWTPQSHAVSPVLRVRLEFVRKHDC